MSVGEPLEEFLRSKSKGGEDSGNYRRNLERCIEDFLEWLEEDSRSDGTFDELDERTFRRYARELAGRDLEPGTVRIRRPCVVYSLLPDSEGLKLYFYYWRFYINSIT